MPKANDTRDRAVLILHRGPMTAGEFGAAMWPGRTGRITSTSGGGDYAAQMLLGRLRAKGIVRTTLDPGATRWELTSRGKELRRAAGDGDWRPTPCRKCGTQLMNWWRFCPFCGQQLPLVVYDGK